MAFIYDPATRPGIYGDAKLTELQNNARTVNLVVHAIALPDPEGTDQMFAALPPGTDAILLENSAINLVLQERRKFAEACIAANVDGVPSVVMSHIKPSVTFMDYYST